MTIEDFLKNHPNLNIGEHLAHDRPTWHFRWYEDRWLVWDTHSTPVVKAFTDINEALAFLAEKTGQKL